LDSSGARRVRRISWLSGANLSKADLSAASLDDASLFVAVLIGTWISDATLLGVKVARVVGHILKRSE
jgi:uncharacterized protein YjbI with pentapeptide repeats